MKLNPFFQSALTFLIRRGLTLLGTAGATVSDEWITQTVSILLMAGNEGFQWYLAHKAVKPKPVPTVEIKP